jgi:hypothetical protein
LKLGNEVVDDVKNYQTNKFSMDIYKMYEIKAVLPGVSQLHV